MGILPEIETSTENRAAELDTLNSVALQYMSQNNAYKTAFSVLCSKISELETELLALNKRTETQEKELYELKEKTESDTNALLEELMERSRAETDKLRHSIEHVEQLVYSEASKLEVKFPPIDAEFEKIHESITELGTKITANSREFTPIKRHINDVKNEVKGIKDTIEEDQVETEGKLSTLQAEIQMEFPLIRESIDQRCTALSERDTEIEGGITDFIERLEKLETQRRNERLPSANKIEVQKHVERSIMKQNMSKQEYETDLVPFNVPDPLREKIESRIQAIVSRGQSRDEEDELQANEEFVQVCKLSEAYTRNQIRNSTVYDPNTLRPSLSVSMRLADVEATMNNMCELIRISSEKIQSNAKRACLAKNSTSRSTQSNDKILELEREVERLSKAIIEIPKARNAKDSHVFSIACREYFKQKETELIVEPYHPEENHSRGGFEITGTLASSQIEALSVSLSEISRNLHAFRFSTPHLITNENVLKCIDSVLAVVDSSLQVVQDPNIENQTATKEMFRVIKALYDNARRLKSQTTKVHSTHKSNDYTMAELPSPDQVLDSLCTLAESFSDYGKDKVDQHSKQLQYVQADLISLSTSLSSCNEDMKAVQQVCNSLKKQLKSVENIPRSEDITDLIKTIKSQISFELGVGKSKSMKVDLERKLGQLSEELEFLKKSSLSVNCMRIIEKSLEGKADKCYVERLLGVQAMATAKENRVKYSDGNMKMDIDISDSKPDTFSESSPHFKGSLPHLKGSETPVFGFQVLNPASKIHSRSPVKSISRGAKTSRVLPKHKDKK